jgi:hypothetical protein
MSETGVEDCTICDFRNGAERLVYSQRDKANLSE